jgi:hypothetical protein
MIANFLPDGQYIYLSLYTELVIMYTSSGEGRELEIIYQRVLLALKNTTISFFSRIMFTVYMLCVPRELRNNVMCIIQISSVAVSFNVPHSGRFCGQEVAFSFVIIS